MTLTANGERSVLTVDASAGGVAAPLLIKTVSVSNASRPEELLAFVMNRIVVVSQKQTTAFTYGMFKAASLGRCEEKPSFKDVITGVAVSK